MVVAEKCRNEDKSELYSAVFSDSARDCLKNLTIDQIKLMRSEMSEKSNVTCYGKWRGG